MRTQDAKAKEMDLLLDELLELDLGVMSIPPEAVKPLDYHRIEKAFLCLPQKGEKVYYAIIYEVPSGLKTVIRNRVDGDEETLKLYN